MKYFRKISSLSINWSWIIIGVDCLQQCCNQTQDYNPPNKKSKVTVQTSFENLRIVSRGWVFVCLFQCVVDNEQNLRRLTFLSAILCILTCLTPNDLATVPQAQFKKTFLS